MTNTDNLSASESTVNRNDASAPSSSRVKSPSKPQSSGMDRAQTEISHLTASNYEIPCYTRDTLPIVGNKNFELSLRMEGRIGHWMDRSKTAFPEVNCEIQVANYKTGVTRALTHVLTDLARLKQSLSVHHRIENVAAVLTNGTMVMTYLKLRAINLFRPTEGSKFYPKPKVPDHFEVPTPFGHAISQLGVVEVSSLPKRMICYPTADQASASTYLCTIKHDWSQTAYAEAVHYAKSLGMELTTVDLSVKVGSSWWLFQPKLDDGLFSLRCPLPEDNYTLAGAVVHMLFNYDVSSDPAIELFNLAGIPDADYGSFIRNPHDGFNFSAYYAISNR